MWAIETFSHHVSDWNSVESLGSFFVCSLAKLDKTYDSICVDYMKLTPHLFGLALPISRGGGNRSDVRSNKGVGR